MNQPAMKSAVEPRTTPRTIATKNDAGLPSSSSSSAGVKVGVGVESPWWFVVLGPVVSASLSVVELSVPEADEVDVLGWLEEVVVVAGVEAGVFLGFV